MMRDLLQMLRLLRARVRALFRRDAVADEIREELEFHLRMRAEGYERAGEAPDRAAQHARARVGNLTVLQDRGYDVRGGGFLETVLQDVRYGVRQLARQPGFSVVAILTLALGIGLSAALFSVIDAALLHPVPYPHPEQLVTIHLGEHRADGLGRGYAPSVADIRKWRGISSVIAHIGSGRVSGFTQLIVDTGVAQRLVVASASEDFLEAYGVAPILGRGFRIEDTRQGAPAVALLGHAFWQSQFGGDSAVLGRIIRIQNAPVAIVGVLPAGFFNQTAVWQASQWPDAWLDRRASGTPVVARLRPGVTPEEAAQQLTAATAPSALFGPKPSPAHAIVVSLYDDQTSGYGKTLRILGWAVALIVFIACLNVAGLLLARGATRRQELAVRASIGAGRGRLVRQLLVESLVLAFAGSAAGVGLAFASLDSLVAVIPLSLPANSPPRIDITVLAFTFLLTVVTALAFGLAPAVKLTRANLRTTLSGSDRDAAAPLSRRSGQWLIGIEVALAIVLVSGAALMLRSFARLLDVNLGYDPLSVLTLEVEPLDQTSAVRARFYPALQAALLRLPEVSVVGAIEQDALTGGSTYYFPKADTGVDVDGPQRVVLPGYFEAIALRPLMGRLLTDADRATGDAALINATGNAKYFSGDAIGHTLVTSGPQPRAFRIVGVVPDLKHAGPLDRGGPQMYILPNVRSNAATATSLAMVMRVRGGGDLAPDRLKLIAESIGPRILVGRVRPASALIDQQVERPRNRMVLLTILGGLGLSLTLVGIFGMTAYAVARRTREIGVRIAIGATSRDVLTMILADVATPVAIGVMAGLGAAALATRIIASFLFETKPTDPGAFALVAVTIVVAALLAAWMPSRRALRIDPVSALRAE